MSWTEIIFLAGAVFTFAGRFTVPGRDLNWESRYEAIVHIWLGAYIMWCIDHWHDQAVDSLAFALIIIALTIFEIYKFMTR